MSGHKGLLWIVQWLAIAGAVIGIGTAAGVTWGRVAPATAEPWIHGVFWGAFPVFAVALLVVLELTSLVRGGSWWRQPEGEITLQEMKACVHWCPTPVVVACLAGEGVLFLALAVNGETDWHSGVEFTAHHAVGFGLGGALFYLASIPVLVSAVRMPGRFADHA
jgi:hypothetical protein